MDESLRFEFQELKDRLDEIERRQMLANSRIRQDAAYAVLVGGMILLVICLMWYGIKPDWWHGLGLLILYTASAAKIISDIQKREEPR